MSRESALIEEGLNSVVPAGPAWRRARLPSCKRLFLGFRVRRLTGTLKQLQFMLFV